MYSQAPRIGRMPPSKFEGPRELIESIPHGADRRIEIAVVRPPHSRPFVHVSRVRTDPDGTSHTVNSEGIWLGDREVLAVTRASARVHELVDEFNATRAPRPAPFSGELYTRASAQTEHQQ